LTDPPKAPLLIPAGGAFDDQHGFSIDSPWRAQFSEKNPPYHLRSTRCIGAPTASIINAVSKATKTRVDVQALKLIAIFCGVGLAVSLIVATYGLDLSWAFF
jgi:hypothetical protein